MFLDLLLPRLDGTSLTCVGVRLEGDAERWREAAVPCATAGELAYARRFRQPLDATRHLVGRALIRTVLAREFGLAVLAAEFAVNSWGKPALPGCGVEFNISHSGDAVWVALCRGTAVGIDVEREDAAADQSVVAETFHPAERAELAALAASDAQRALFRCWTRKEAIIKAVGEGLSRPLSNFRVRTDECSRNWLVEAPATPVTGWTVADLPVATGYHGSVAAMAPGLAIEYHVQ